MRDIFSNIQMIQMRTGRPSALFAALLLAAGAAGVAWDVSECDEALIRWAAGEASGIQCSANRTGLVTLRDVPAGHTLLRIPISRLLLEPVAAASPELAALWAARPRCGSGATLAPAGCASDAARELAAAVLDSHAAWRLATRLALERVGPPGPWSELLRSLRWECLLPLCGHPRCEAARRPPPLPPPPPSNAPHPHPTPIRSEWRELQDDELEAAVSQAAEGAREGAAAIAAVGPPTLTAADLLTALSLTVRFAVELRPPRAAPAAPVPLALAPLLPLLPHVAAASPEPYFGLDAGAEGLVVWADRHLPAGAPLTLSRGHLGDVEQLVRFGRPQSWFVNPFEAALLPRWWAVGGDGGARAVRVWWGDGGGECNAIPPGPDLPPHPPPLPPPSETPC